MKLIQTYLIYKNAKELRFLYNNRRYFKNTRLFTDYGIATASSLKSWAIAHRYDPTPRRYVFKCS